MSGLQQNRKTQDLQEIFPGCMGRMINIFDLSAGMAGTKLLTDKPHRDGSPNRRNRTELVKKAIDPAVLRSEEKQISNEPRKSSPSKKSGGTPMKMLLAQEMSKETESKRKSPNVVARLMGLEEALPAQQSVLSSKGSLQEGRSSHVTLPGALNNCRQRKDGYSDRLKPGEIHSCAPEEEEYRDVYEVWQQPPRTSRIKDQSLHRGRCSENQNDRRMALVRQKFMEAKRLATDERLLQSKEFQDALEVLSSNRDLFLKFLEEPNSLFSKHLKEIHSIPPPPQTKRITILKPSKTVEKQQYPENDDGLWDMNKPQWNSSVNQKADILSQPTRIVVLKPSPGKLHDMKPMVTPHISYPDLMEKSDTYRGSETGEAIGSREVAKEITRHIRENLDSNRRDEALLSSVLSNGYVGDESSFNRSDNDYVVEEEEEGCNVSDSEIVTPTSRHSWDYTNRFGSPYSFSSISRASYSPESSVIREAKKRLSERWAMVASNGINQAQMQVRRSSSTLGEMLAIPEVKKEDGSCGGLSVSSSRSCDGEEDLRAPTACLSIGRTKDGDGGEKSPWNLSRSKSVPVSSSAYGSIGLIMEAPDSQTKKTNAPREAAKSKSGISSLRGKVSSLFFSKNKKAGREKSTFSPLVGSDCRIRSSTSETVAEKNDDLSRAVHMDHSDESKLVNSEEDSIAVASPNLVKDGREQGKTTSKAAISLEKASESLISQNEGNLSTYEKSSENQDQPSPTSILDAQFEDDTNNSTPNCSEIMHAENTQALSRSQPIESVARYLSWDDTHLETSLPNSLKLSRTLPKEDKEEQERFSYVLNLMSAAGFNNENLNTIFPRWHSLDSPLDPVLLDKFLDRKEEEAKSRERRSDQRLLFDCVNAALLDIGRTAILGAYPWDKACTGAQKVAPAGASVAAEVWELVRYLFSREGKWASGEADNSSLVAEKLLRRDIVGSGWAEMMRSEIDEISKEIGGEVLEELVGEALAELTGGCL